MIPLAKPHLDENELNEINQVLSTGYLTQGPKTAEFEQMVADLISAKYAFAMSSGTTALHLALVILDVQPGDEVLVADFTFPATANVVVQLGATPVLADIKLDTFTLDPEDMRRKITPRTKAVIPVDAFGCAADFDPILAIAEEHNLPVVEDAATAIGATYHGRFCGNLATIGCFSFHPRKVITTGEGGMITTNDSRLADRIRLLRSHGGVRTGAWFHYEAAGFNYRLSDILSAMGIAQMKKLSWLIERKRELAELYNRKLSNIPGIRAPINPAWGGHIYQSYVILLNEKLDRNRIVEQMKARNVETTIGTYALHDQSFFQRTFGYQSGQLPNSHAAFTRSVALPLYAQLTEAEVNLVVAALDDAIREQQR